MLWHVTQVLLWSSLMVQTVHLCVDRVLPFCENRLAEDLAKLKDPVLERLPRVDLTVWINWLQHGCNLLFVPNLLYVALECSAQEFGALILAFTLVVLMRCLCLLITPLEVPYGHIHLQDEIQNRLLSQPRVGYANWDRDLMFSGHVSLLVMAGLTQQLWPDLARWYFCAAVLQACLLLLSRVHYTIDVVVAPFMSYGCWQLARWLWLS